MLLADIHKTLAFFRRAILCCVHKASWDNPDGTQGNVEGEGTTPNLIEIGVFAEDEKNEKGMTRKVPLYLEKHWLEPGTYTLEIIVEEKPEKAGIDPYNKLIDRIPDDNLKPVAN